MWPPARLQLGPRHGVEKAVMRPAVGTTHRLSHEHVMLVTPLNQDVVEEIPSTRVRVHPRYLLLQWNSKDVGQESTVFCAGLQKKRAITVAATDAMATEHSLLDSMVRGRAGAEVTKDDQFIRPRHIC
nr:unnamed protein product [Spirometra erinaceieuropaei]